MECFGAFIAVGNYFSPKNPDAPFVIEELEVNPFALVDYEMVPLDGLCKFSRPFRPAVPRGIDRIGNLLHPESIGIIGVSASKMNFGRNILNNVVRAGFPKDRITLVSPKADEIDGVACVKDITGIDGVDLFVVAVGAGHVPALIDEIIDNNRARSVLLIPGGLGEKEGTEKRAKAVMEKIHSAHSRDGGSPVFLGGNCLGMISRAGKLDTFFTPDACSPKRMEKAAAPVALVSQSGAFALVRMSGVVAGDPAYNITVGNQVDLTIGDFITWLADADDVGIICIYAEGFQDMDGLHACRGIRRAVENGKEVIVYKAGRTPEGKKATSGHTASVAGDYMVCTSCLSQAGALVTDSLEEFDGLMNLSAYLHEKQITGFRVGALSPAGFETVGVADSLQSRDSCLDLPEFGPETEKVIARLFDHVHLTDIMDIKNPLDLTPAATDPVYTGAIEAMLDDEVIDAVVTSVGSLAPATWDTPAPDDEQGFTTSSKSITNTLPDIIRGSDKPVVVFNDVGQAHEAINNRFRDQGIPVFRSCNQAMSLLARYTAYRFRLAVCRQAENQEND
ncbi:MAG: CoA-binding protein [Desulfobacterales bacterium]|nr:CoA-binding protein [Desulfobacterales bacterium]